MFSRLASLCSSCAIFSACDDTLEATSFESCSIVASGDPWFIYILAASGAAASVAPVSPPNSDGRSSVADTGRVES